MLNELNELAPPALPWVSEPPAPIGRYTPEKALEDLPRICYALHLFLASHMVESEEFCHKCDPSKERLYLATGFGLIQCVKSLMSFEDEDLVAAIGHVRHGSAVASQHRKRLASLPTRLAGLLVNSLNTTGVGWIKSMTAIERHAELVYAESLYERAIVGIAYSGDWLAFIKEALNMRTAFNIYRQLGKYLEAADAEAAARGEGPEDKSIDAHFRSGVYLGVGSSNLVLSMMPSRLVTLIELFGYKGDRKVGLELLYKAGGWTKDSQEPGVSHEQEGVRRTICDMCLLVFHLVLSGFTYDGVDINMAQKILEYNLKRYPNGVFFLFGQGRLSLCRSQPAEAIEYYKKAMDAQDQYRNLHHISYWEMAIAYLALWDVPSSLECWRQLEAEATWSKATYTYGVTACLLQMGGEEEREEAKKRIGNVGNLRQRIAGKSIPLEKFVARKARKCQDQGGRLALPALEFCYHFMCIGRAPRSVIVKKMLPLIDTTLATLKTHEKDPSTYEGKQRGYWEDLLLASFLRGVCLRYVAYPEPDAVIDPEEKLPISKADAVAQATTSFQLIFTHGPKIELDHFIVYFAHFELGRLLACKGDKEGARTHLELVISGRPLEVNAAARRNSLHVRTNAALEALDHATRL
ncbi:unnamed protein product [Somion occarium]|uniref:Tetratricopeptide repeat protein 39B n=1 Tax=Somion occarium TaxID=3059160 RepID=A0ABP1CTT1_9APHY